MLKSEHEKKKIISDLKRRIIEILISVPFGIAFAVLFWTPKLALSPGLQLFLTVLCWGALVVIIEIVAMAILKAAKKRNEKSPKADPFSDKVVKVEPLKTVKKKK